MGTTTAQTKEMTREELLRRVETLEERNAFLQNRIDWLEKQLFGTRSEKRLPLSPDALQPSLFGDELTPEEKAAIEADTENAGKEIEKSVKPKKKPSRRELDTTGLPVRETHLYPEGTTDEDGNLKEGYVEIGTEISDRLGKVPAQVYVDRTIRHKVIWKGSETEEGKTTVLIAPLPPSAVERGMAGESILADIIISKFLYHLPFYRQIEQYRECGLRVPNSTIEGWFEVAVDNLRFLYMLLRQRVMSSQYIHVDESTVPIIDNEKHKTRKGYLWCVVDGITRDVFFFNDRGSRSKETARKLLGSYRGVFQSDGYEAYDQFCDKEGVQGAACWAHARRYWVNALKEDEKLASQMIMMIGKLYKVEKESDELSLAPDEKKDKRRRESYPVIRLIEKWCIDTYPKVLEKSLVGKAIAYTYGLLERLSVYVNDGRIDIDNNAAENAIRPLALGRKNWLFCGNDAAADRAAIVYSLIATCRNANLDPRQWLEHVLLEIPQRKKEGLPLDDLLPSEYAKRPGAKAWSIPDRD